MKLKHFNKILMAQMMAVLTALFLVYHYTENYEEYYLKKNEERNLLSHDFEVVDVRQIIGMKSQELDFTGNDDQDIDAEATQASTLRRDILNGLRECEQVEIIPVTTIAIRVQSDVGKQFERKTIISYYEDFEKCAKKKESLGRVFSDFICGGREKLIRISGQAVEGIGYKCLWCSDSRCVYGKGVRVHGIGSNADEKKNENWEADPLLIIPPLN